MIITIERYNADRRQFNVALSSAQGKDAFVTLKDARIVTGAKGPFVSWPARKDDNGKYWPYIYGSEAFNAAVLKAVEEHERALKPSKDDSDIPF